MVLTCLIWIYADQENVTSSNEVVSLTVSPQSGSELFVELQEPSTGQLQVTFAGPRFELERFKKDLGKFKPVYFVQPEEVKGDTLNKDAAEIINSAIRKNYKGIVVQDVKPAQIKIFVDPMITVPMPVRVRTGATKTDVPVITPSKVQVTMPRSTYMALYDTEKFLDIDLESELQNKAEDREINEYFSLPTSFAGQDVVTSPPRVKIQLKIKQQSVSKDFPINQVKVMGPPELLAKYRVDILNPQFTVTLKGPLELISTLKPQSIIAYIQLDPEDMIHTSYFFKPASFKLPEGIKLDTTKMLRPPGVDFKLIDIHVTPPTETK